MTSAILRVESLHKRYGEGASAVTAIEDVSFSVHESEFVCVVGPSGCGKTTLLKSLSGLIMPTGGTVAFRGRHVSGPPDEMALVFQDYSRSLMPWMTVRSNVEMPLRHKRLGRQERQSLATDALTAVGLESFLDHFPWQLSGGMQQRVAIARAIAYQPDILLMDEPFASVDAQTRIDLEDLILRVQDRYKMTVVFVTHDIDESVYLSDRIIVLGARPTEVQEVITVDLPRPRDQVRTKELAGYTNLRARVYNLIKQQT